eukprot:Nk52_evm40s226 gene=Nk52_evmTU40s226
MSKPEPFYIRWLYPPKKEVPINAYRMRTPENEGFYIPEVCMLVYEVCERKVFFDDQVKERLLMLLREKEAPEYETVEDKVPEQVEVKAKEGEENGSSDVDVVEKQLQKSSVAPKSVVRGRGKNAQDGHGLNALHVCCQYGRDEMEEEYNFGAVSETIFSILIAEGVDLEARDNFGRTPIHYAVAKNHRKMLLQCISHNANFFALTNEEQTILHTAARYDCAKLIESLMEYLMRMDTEREQQEGHDNYGDGYFKFGLGDELVFSPIIREFRDKEDVNGRTAMHVAALFDMTGATATLLKYGSDPGQLDHNGQSCLVNMISRVPGVAKQALNHLVSIDKAGRKRMYVLTPLEYIDDDGEYDEDEAAVLNKSALKEIVKHNVLSLVTHPAVDRLMERKWLEFASYGEAGKFVLYIIFVVSWTLSSLWVPGADWDSYDGASGVLKLIVEVIGIIILFYYIFVEIWELNQAHKHDQLENKFRLKNIANDMRYVPHDDSWPDYEFYLSEYRLVKTSPPFGDYFFDPFNYADWTSYLLYLISTAIHIKSMISLGKEGDDNRVLLSFALIVNWAKILKYARTYRVFGPFVVMLFRMVGDIAKFVFLYSVFLIPFSISFYIIWKDHGIQDYSDFGESVMSLFRMTVIDFEYADLEAAEPILAPIYVSLWIFISGILFINLFIAMMSTTFQIVYDNSKAIAAMQRAGAILTSEESLSQDDRSKHLQKLAKDASEENPDVEFYDDDEADEDDESLINLREQISFDLKKIQDDMAVNFKTLQNMNTSLQVAGHEDHQYQRQRPGNVGSKGSLHSQETPRERALAALAPARPSRRESQMSLSTFGKKKGKPTKKGTGKFGNFIAKTREKEIDAEQPEGEVIVNIEASEATENPATEENDLDAGVKLLYSAKDGLEQQGTANEDERGTAPLVPKGETSGPLPPISSLPPIASPSVDRKEVDAPSSPSSKERKKHKKHKKHKKRSKIEPVASDSENPHGNSDASSDEGHAQLSTGDGYESEENK